MKSKLVPLVLIAPGIIGALVGWSMLSGLVSSSLVFLSVQTDSGIVPMVVGGTLSGIGLLAWRIRVHQRQTLDRAVAAERMSQTQARMRFVHRLNHELKNPLTAMHAGLANLAVDRANSRGSLDNVSTQVDRLSRLVNDLRKLADLETREMERESVDLVGLMHEVVEMVRAEPARSSRDIRLNIQQIPWELGPIRGDRDLLLLAIYNLLDNALKFSSIESVVEIRVLEDEMWTTIEVVDSGAGIDSNDLSHVTEELYRGRGQQNVEGSGLGLALVERIVWLHGGRLAFRSRTGKGTIAALRIPLK